MELTNEDNIELMARYEDNYFDLAIVDPPYGIDNKLASGGRGFNQKYRDSNKWDIKPKKEYFNELKRVCKNYIIWGGNYFSNYLLPNRCFLVWYKLHTKPLPTMADCELALTSFDKNAKIYESRNGGEKIHPTQKPVKLYEWLLMNYAKEGDKILDTHLGSGSIAIACHNLGYDLTACELDKEYYNAAIKRINEHKQQIRMF
jgi:site-specific DNA-methyltransferase (adenine-specific)